MFRMTCPDCGAPLGDSGDDPKPVAECASCGWRECSKSAKSSSQDVMEEEAADPKAGRTRRRRKKRRRQIVADDSGRSWASIPTYAIGTAVLVLLWAILAGLSLASPRAAYSLIGCGAVTVLSGAVSVLLAAQEDGIDLWTFSSGNPIVAVVLLVVQILAIPVLSLVHLFLNIDAAWRPALVLLLGVAMTASGVALSP